MSKLLANLFLLCAALATSLGNYWYTYGLWPQSWESFVGFGLLGIVLLLVRAGLDAEK